MNPWKLRPREGYCKACNFVVAVGWRSGLKKLHAQAWSRRHAENGMQHYSNRDIDWCKGSGKTPEQMPVNPIDPWCEDGRHEA